MAIEAPDSEIDLCNLALDHLKQKPITAIDPPVTAVEELMSRWYQQIRRATLRSHVWNFALKRTTILPTGSAPAFQYTHAYTLPTDFIRYIGRYDDEGFRLIDDDYEIEGNEILLNGEDATAINVRYIYNNTTITEFDPLFISLFSLNLAIAIGSKFSGSEARVKTLIELQKDVKAEATAIDGQERPPKRRQTSKFMTARKSTRAGVAGQYTLFD